MKIQYLAHNKTENTIEIIALSKRTDPENMRKGFEWFIGKGSKEFIGYWIDVFLRL